MTQELSHFTKQFPPNAVLNVEKHVFADAALLKPNVYLAEPMRAVDYSVIIPSDTPPDSYVNGKLKRFSSGKIIVFNPCDSIVNVTAPPTKQYYTLLIRPRLVRKIAEEMGCPGEVRFLRWENPFSMDLLQAIRTLDEETKRRDSFKLMFDCLLVQIVALLLREFKTNLRKYPSHSPESKTYINLAIEYMQTFFSSNITIEDMCREINISPFHFIRSFKQKMGVSPYQYLLMIRIKKAEELLVTGRYSVSETASLCGFVNPSHFSDTFKRFKGCPPSAYQKFSQIEKPQ